MPVSGPWTVWSGSHGSFTPWQTSTAGSSTAWSPGNHHLLRRRKIQIWRENIPASNKLAGNFKLKNWREFFYLRMRNLSEFLSGNIWFVFRKGKPSYKEDNEVICTSYYSALKPVDGGEISISLGTEKQVQWRSNFDFLMEYFYYRKYSFLWPN